MDGIKQERGKQPMDSKGINKIKLLQAITTIVTGIIMLKAVLKNKNKNT